MRPGDPACSALSSAQRFSHSQCGCRQSSFVKPQAANHRGARHFLRPRGQVVIKRSIEIVRGAVGWVCRAGVEYVVSLPHTRFPSLPSNLLCLDGELCGIGIAGVERAELEMFCHHAIEVRSTKARWLFCHGAAFIEVTAVAKCPGDGALHVSRFAACLAPYT